MTSPASHDYDEVEIPMEPPAYENPRPVSDHLYIGLNVDGGIYSEPYEDVQNGNNIPMRHLDTSPSTKKNMGMMGMMTVIDFV